MEKSLFFSSLVSVLSVCGFTHSHQPKLYIRIYVGTWIVYYNYIESNTSTIKYTYGLIKVDTFSCTQSPMYAAGVR